jgi:hypothetical protein
MVLKSRLGPFSPLTYILDASAPTVQASWQTIFWILVNLSIGAMAQPGGRICGFPSRYRTYLRCSPLICGADMLSIVVRLLVTIIYLRLSLLESVGILLHDRFDNSHTNEEINNSLALQSEDNDNEGDGIQALEGMTWLRWIWFLLGTLPPAIKLASMSGVGWAQAWGMMFLGSWLLNEFLIIFATLNQSFFTISSSGRISWPGYEHITRSPKYHQVKRYLDLGEKCLGMTALIMHVVVVNNIFRIISRLLDGTSPLTTVEIFETYPRYIRPNYVLTVSAAVWVPAGLMIFIFGLQSNALACFILGLFFIMLGNLAGNSWVYRSSHSNIYTPVHVWTVSTIMTSVLVLVIGFLSQRFIMIGRNLLVLYRNGTEGQFSLDYGACLAFIFFLSTIGASLFWYGKIYNPDGTSVPVWTGVFG